MFLYMHNQTSMQNISIQDHTQNI